MAFPPLPERTYHVFLSFRGPDSGDNLASHFYGALGRAGIHTYYDREELEKGERISDALFTAIKDSCIALIIFSNHYATSRWCLEEVTKIMEHKDTDGLLVLPLFLGVEPREVRGGRQEYKMAIDGYETRCMNGTAEGFSSDDVKNWKEALNKAGNLSGWVYSGRKITWLDNGTPVESGSKEFKDEATLVDVIVQYISEKLERIPLYVDDNTADMQSQVIKVTSILDMRSEDEVQDKGLMIGLWGMVRMGKTTLAKLIYNSIFKKFPHAAFVEVGSHSESLRSLQKEMLRRLTHAKIRVANRPEGIALMIERLKFKRILLILDGVEDVCQIDDLIGKGKDFLKNGSRIIITTRNKSLLLTREATIYEVKALAHHKARQFLHKCASRNGEEEVSRELVERALQCTGCVPFALQKLGSHFRDKKDTDSNIVENFESWSDLDIHKELVTSLVGLDDITTDVFLDIACFFNRWNRKYVEGFLGVRHVKRLDGHSSDDRARKAKKYVDVLVERSLITDENGTLQVQPLIKLMGHKVAGGEAARNLRTSSRLWCWDDVNKVLSDVKGKYDVEAIVCAPEETKELDYIDSSVFTRLENLSFFIMTNVKVKKFPPCIDLPHQLRWFEWPEFTASRLTFSSSPWNPAVLAVRKSLSLSNRGEP